MLENYLDKILIKPELTSTSKEEVLKELAHLITWKYKNLPPEVIESALKEREKMDSTGIEEGIAIPHAKLDGIDKLTIAVGCSKKGINFNAHDNKPTHLFFAFLAPTNATGEHMKVLARLAKLLTTHGLKEKLLEAKNIDTIYRELIAADKKLC